MIILYVSVEDSASNSGWDSRASRAEPWQVTISVR